MKKSIIGITVVGKDKEGIVAAFTNFVFQQKANIEKVNQNVIKGLFGMYLEASFTKPINVKKFETEINSLAKQMKMDVSTHYETNTEKNIAIFVTKESHCLNELLKANSNGLLKGKICAVIGTEQTLSQIVKRNNGFINKFIGDSVMALFNATVDDGDHLFKCVKAAIEMFLLDHLGYGYFPCLDHFQIYEW